MPDGFKPRILVVDDEPSIRESLGMLLMSVGYDVDIAENGASAISQLNRIVPNLIVTDLNMPLMSGIDLISRVRSQHPSIAIVAMSGDYEGTTVPAGFTADRFYPKGLHPHHLLIAIADLITTNAERGNAHESRTQPALDS
jgi:two-component system, NtrC family, response regulator HydG